jgi:hypothetical protein
MWFIISLTVVFVWDKELLLCNKTGVYVANYGYTFRLCYSFKTFFSSNRYCIGKKMHMKTVYGDVRGEDSSRKMKKMAMVKNQGMWTISNLHRMWILRSCGIYTRRAQIETASQRKPEFTHIAQSKLTS